MTEAVGAIDTEVIAGRQERLERGANWANLAVASSDALLGFLKHPDRYLSKRGEIDQRKLVATFPPEVVKAHGAVIREEINPALARLQDFRVSLGSLLDECTAFTREGKQLVVEQILWELGVDETIYNLRAGCRLIPNDFFLQIAVEENNEGSAFEWLKKNLPAKPGFGLVYSAGRWGLKKVISELMARGNDGLPKVETAKKLLTQPNYNPYLPGERLMAVGSALNLIWHRGDQEEKPVFLSLFRGMPTEKTLRHEEFHHIFDVLTFLKRDVDSMRTTFEPSVKAFTEIAYKLASLFGNNWYPVAILAATMPFEVATWKRAAEEIRLAKEKGLFR